MKDKNMPLEYFVEELKNSTEMVSGMWEGMQEASDDNMGLFLASYLLSFKERFLIQYTLDQNFDDYSAECEELVKALAKEKDPTFFTGDVIDGLSILILTNQPEQLITEYLGHMKRFQFDHEIFYMMAGLSGFSLVKKPYPGDYYKNLYNAVKEKSTNLLYKFLDDWYSESSDEAWYNSHQDESRGLYVGYWCLEAAAIAKTHQLWDDRILNHQHFPKDLIL